MPTSVAAIAFALPMCTLVVSAQGTVAAMPKSAPTATTASAASTTPTNAAIQQATAQASSANATLKHATQVQQVDAQAYADAKAALKPLQAALTKATAAESKAYTNYQHATSANRTALKDAYIKSITARQAAAKNLTNATNLSYADGHRLDYANTVLSKAQTVATAANTLLAGVRKIYLVPVSGSPGRVKLVEPTLLHTMSFGGTQVSANWSVYDTSYNNGDGTRLPSNVQVSHNVLHLVSTDDSGAGLCLCGPTRIPTPYGSYQVREKVDPNSDHGAATILWPDSGNWPTDGEIDLAEFNGARTEALYTLHWGAKNYERHLWTTGNFTQWHTFRLDWTPRGIAYYIDGNILSATTESQIIPVKPMHLSIQMGPTKAKPRDTTAQLQVAWVKTYSIS